MRRDPGAAPPRREGDRLSRLAPWLIWPLLVAGGVGVVNLAIGHGLAAPVALIGLNVIAVLVVAGLERVLPEHPSWNRPHGDLVADALHFVVSGIIISGALRLLIFLAMPSIGLWPAGWPVAAQLVLALLLADLGSYATHMATHRVALLWPIHAVHHSSRRLYWLNSARMHPLDAASTVLISLVPLAILGVPPAVLALFDAFAIVHLLVQHSNIRLRHGLLSHVFATAEFHRWHHSPERAEGERNYASFLSIWDHLFRTFKMPAGRQPPEVVGLYDGATMSDRWISQERHPFQVWSGTP